MNKKVVIPLIALIMVLSGGILAWRAWWTPKDETVNWMTYRNEDYGFEIKYPTNWQLDLRGAPSLVRFDVKGDNFLIEEQFKERVGEHAYYDWRFTDDIKISIYTSLNELPGNENNLSLEEWIKERMENYLILKNSKKEIMVNQYKGVEVIELGYGSWRSIFLVRNPLIYAFSLMTPHKEMDNFNQMLSTFRFSPH